jgi:AmiR/NasT family two-component response regulator
MRAGPRGSKSIAELIRNFRSLRMLCLVPPGPESDEFIQHLKRMGCNVDLQWPPPHDLPDNLDVVFLAVRPVIEEDIAFNWKPDQMRAALIALVDYENPLIVEATLHLKAQSTIGMPFRSFGVMIDVLLSVANFKRERALLLKAQRLASKINMLAEIEKAKSIMAEKYGIDGDFAYEIIRKQAMNRRTTIESIARTIVAGNDILNLDLTDERTRRKL